MIAGIEHVAELIRRESGMALRPTRLAALAAAAERLAPGLDGPTLAGAAVKDRDANGLLARLIDAVAVNETFFFRHRQEFDAIDWLELVRAAAADGRDRVRVWSAACASGEEAYTLAMMAGEALRGTASVSILASDISHHALKRARAGVYGERSVRLMPAEMQAKHLFPLGRGYGIDPELRALVRFRHHNLVSGSFPPADETPFDLIVCRNVLIYFEPDVGARVLASLERGLAPGGRLMLGTADRLCEGARVLAAAAPAPPRSMAPRRSSPRAARLQNLAPAVRSEPSLTAAVSAADAGRLDEALEITGAVLAADPLDAAAHYVRGVAELARGEAPSAVTALRRALYLDPQLPVAAFQLARAHDSLSQAAPARRAYAQALRILEQGEVEQAEPIDGLDPADLKAACQARLHALGSGTTTPRPGRAA